MDENLESQTEEEEVLLAIYDGDPAFKHVSSTIIQYRCGEDGDKNSVLIEISWPQTYPSEKPNVNLNTFYNNHLNQTLKNFILDKVLEKAEQYLGVAMTYTLIEYVKDNLESWTADLPQQPTNVETKMEEHLEEDISNLSVTETKKPTVKKEHLSKAQKRRQWDRCDMKGERPRGWNWVDIVKHLSQTGSKAEDLVTTSC